MKRDVAILKVMDERWESQISHQQQEVLSSKGRVKLFYQSSEGFLATRRRFIDGYKRDVLEMDRVRGSSSIQQGNTTAQEGDTVGDALLYSQGQ